MHLLECFFFLIKYQNEASFHSNSSQLRAADVSKMGFLQRGLKAFSDRKSRAFSRGRELELSVECLINQAELEELNTDDDFLIDLMEPDLDICDIEAEGLSSSMECDYKDITIDSASCESAGGSLIKINMEMECGDLVSTKMLNIPTCLHDTCDAKEYAEFAEDVLGMADMGSDDFFDVMPDCDYDISIVSGAAIGSTSIISIGALVSLFAMLW